MQFWVNKKSGSAEDIHSFNENFLQKKFSDVRFAAERMLLYPKLKNKRDLFFFSPASTGMDISGHPAVRWADIIHLHWFNQGFLSLQSLEKLAGLGKKIVWTLHDMWAFTGGCHYSRGCESFKNHCGRCPYLSAGNENDGSAEIWKRKSGIYKKEIFTFVTCSRWLAGIASQSSLLKGFTIYSIPNPIDVDVFSPLDKQTARKKLGLNAGKFFILFASQNLGDERKGFRYLREAVEIICHNYPDISQNAEMLVFGKQKVNLAEMLPLPLHSLGTLSSVHDIVAAYNAADVFVLPSLEDNLPNTVMEALSCGVPVVSFNTGGIPEMVEHEKNGWLASQRSSGELAEGIVRIMKNELPYSALSQQARQKVMDNFTHERVAEKYRELYSRVYSRNVSQPGA